MIFHRLCVLPHYLLVSRARHHNCSCSQVHQQHAVGRRAAAPRLWREILSNLNKDVNKHSAAFLSSLEGPIRGALSVTCTIEVFNRTVVLGVSGVGGFGTASSGSSSGTAASSRSSNTGSNSSGEGSRQELISFTCGHVFTRASFFNTILPDFQSRMAKVSSAALIHTLLTLLRMIKRCVPRLRTPIFCYSSLMSLPPSDFRLHRLRP